MQFLYKYGIILFGLLAILPFLILSFMSWPVGMHDWDWVVNMVGVTDQYSYWEEQQYWYNEAMGRYSSTAMLSLTNFWFSPTAYKFFACFQLLFLLSSLYFFFSALLPKTSKSQLVQFAIVILAIYLQNMQSVFEGFYLLSSNLTYQMAVGFSLLFFGCFLKKENKDKTNWILLAICSVLAVIVIGMNEISMLILSGILLVIFFVRLISTKRLNIGDILLGVVVLAALFFEVKAPGNYTRMKLYDGSQDFIFSTGLTLGSGVFLITKWLTTSLLIPISLLYIPIGMKLTEQLKWQFLNKPICSVLVTVGIPFLCLFPIFWSMGMETLPDRVVDTIFMFFIMGWFLSIQSILTSYAQKGDKLLVIPKFVQLALGVFVVYNLFLSGLDLNKDKEILTNTGGNKMFKLFTLNSNVGNAWKDLISGDAYGYHLQQRAAYNKVKNSTTDTIELAPLQYQPQTIYSQKYDRRARGGDKFMSHLFNKKSIIIYKK